MSSIKRKMLLKWRSGGGSEVPERTQILSEVSQGVIQEEAGRETERKQHPRGVRGDENHHRVLGKGWYGWEEHEEGK